MTVSAVDLTFDGAATDQVIEGFGVNINYRSWNGAELQPVVDAFIDQAEMTLMRVVYDLSDWEETNDNADPQSMDWTYYNEVYNSTEFTRLWDMFAYLNSRGITNGAFLNFMGWGPAWMMGADGRTLPGGMEEEWAEMIASALVYARNTRGLQFSLVAPNNEPDIFNEGVHMEVTPYVNSLHQLALQLDAQGLGDVGLIGPDRAGGGTGYMPEMMADPVVMEKLKHFGTHSYSGGGGGSTGVRSFIQGSAYPDRTFWVTEFNVYCSGCDNGTKGTYDWNYTRGTAEYLLSHVQAGASGGVLWEANDSIYAHHGYAWSYWGLFEVDDINAPVKTYTPRKHFYTTAQISKWVRPGAQRIGVSGSSWPLSPILAFKHPGLGQVSIVGVNTSGNVATLNGTLASLPTIQSLDLFYTSATTNLAYGGDVQVLSNGAFSATIPADCVFTLTGFSGVRTALTNPVNEARFTAPATIVMGATATSSEGSIAKVEFYNLESKLGESTNTPYELLWENVPMGDFSLSVRATDALGNTATSAIVNVSVHGPLAKIAVNPVNATVVQGGVQQFTATGTDQLGHALDPQPAVAWSVNGDGTIDGSGLLTAGSLSGGPFNVVASYDGITNKAAFVVSWIGEATIGNTVEGAISGLLWYDGAWIRASRHPVESNTTVSIMRAKVGAITGSYKCAVYTDSNGQPNLLLGSSVEVSNPGTGWQSFPLTSSLALTNGHYYWLAIWSDDANARLYYSGNDGTVRWSRNDYGVWPDPIVATGGSSLNYSIYATEMPPPLMVMSSNLPLAKVGVTYSAQMIVSGGAVPYTWTLVTNPAAPAGLALSTDGLLSIVPSTAGQFTLTAAVTDSLNATVSRDLDLEIEPLIVTLGIPPQTAEEIQTIGLRLTIFANEPGLYAILRTSDFTSWEEVDRVNYTSGTLGLTNQESSGVGSFFYRAVYATDLPPPLMITSSNLPMTTVGVAYSVQLTMSGGVAPYSWALATNPATPVGITLSTSGLLSIVPSTAGQFAVTATVTDSLNIMAIRELDLEIEPLLIVTLGIPSQTAEEIQTSGLRLTISASEPGLYGILRTSDFTSWEEVGLVEYTDGVVGLTNQESGGLGGFFYRAVRH